MEADGLLQKNGRIIVPVSMWPAMLALIHNGHLGSEKQNLDFFSSSWNFEIVTSCPPDLCSNGQAKHCVQTVKDAHEIGRREQDRSSYRSAKLPCNSSVCLGQEPC